MHLVVQASNPATEHQHPLGASGQVLGAHSTRGAEGKAEAPPKPSPSYWWKWGGTGLTQAQGKRKQPCQRASRHPAVCWLSAEAEQGRG